MNNVTFGEGGFWYYETLADGAPEAAANGTAAPAWSGHYRFLKTVEVSLLTQRRLLAPFGLEGGDAGAKRRNVRVSPDGRRIEVPGATSFAAEAGECLLIETPGGGAWGMPMATAR